MRSTQRLCKSGLRVTTLLIQWVANSILSMIEWDHVLRYGNAWYDRLDACGGKPTHHERRQAVRNLQEEIKTLTKNTRLSKSMLTASRGGRSFRAITSEWMGNVFVEFLFPAIFATSSAEDRAATQVQLTEIALSLGAYRTEHGQYPSDLARLIPKYLPELPKDVYTGADFRYRREGAGYVLYSLGPNGKDEGGRSRYMDPPPGDDEELPPGADDIGFRLPAAKP